MMKNNTRGFTLIELLIVIAIIGFIAAAILVAVDPVKRIQDSRDSQRASEIQGILDAILKKQVDDVAQFNGGTGSAIAQISTATLVGTAGDFGVTINGNTVDVSFSTSLTQTASNLATAIDADGTVGPIVNASSAGAVVTITAVTAGSSFTIVDGSSGGNATASIATPTPNVVEVTAVAQVDDITPGGTIEVNDVFTITGIATGSVSFTATAGTVANVTAGLQAAIAAAPAGILVTAVDNTTKVTITAITPGTPFTAVASTTDGGGADTQTLTRSAVIANVVAVTAVAQISTATLSGGEAGTFGVTINGLNINVAFNTSFTQTATDLDAAIDASAQAGNVTATSSGAVVTITSDAAGTAFTISNNSSGGGASATIATTLPNVGAQLIDGDVNSAQVIISAVSDVDCDGGAGGLKDVACPDKGSLTLSIADGEGCVANLGALSPEYIAEIPTDPHVGTSPTATARPIGASNTGYYINRTASGRLTIGACYGEQNDTIRTSR